MIRGPAPRRLLRAGLLMLIGALLVLTIRNWTQGYGPAETDPSRLETAVRAAQLAAQAARMEVRGKETHHAPNVALPSYCDGLQLKNIAFVVKTGASEAQDRLPPQLSTCLSCVPDPLIFSDLEQTLGKYQIHDVLSRVSMRAAAVNPDFNLYFEQRELASKRRIDEIPALGRKILERPDGDDWRTQGKSAAWHLDKYKFLHMIDRAWEYQPNRDWYIFIEADTYLSLSSLVSYLATQDPTKRSYFGNAVQMWEHSTLLFFGHGGSGFILSGATVRAFAVDNKGLAHRFERRVRYGWFGDYLLADALDEYLRVRLTDLAPMMQGENPTNFPLADDSWCKPVITLHHMQPHDLDWVFEFEKAHKFNGIRYRDLFDLIYSEPFPASRHGWDNGSDEAKYAIAFRDKYIELGEDPNEDFAACELACILEHRCVQFSYRTTPGKKSTCHLSRAIRFGKVFEAGDLEPGSTVSSGWLDEKVREWVRQQLPCPG